MPITIGSNIQSLMASRRLNDTSKELSTVYERLSSGMRINKASDDAAGLSIAETLKSDRRVFSQGIRNFNDGLSLLNIADSAIESMTNIVIRLKELAEQSANGVYSSRQRDAIDKESQALSKEYLRIAQTTKFNGINLLDGSLGNGIRLQGGYGLNGGIFSTLGGAIGTGSFNVTGSVSGGSSPRDSAVADFNGDGISDVVTGTSTGFDVRLGDGNGSFSASFSYIGTFIPAVTVNDFNGDGIMDIAASEIFNSTMSIYLGNGNGTFKSGIATAIGISPISIVSGDINGDGIADIVTGEGGTSEIAIYYGTGNGSFSGRTAVATSGNPLSISVADINGDLIDDFVVADVSGSDLTIHYGNRNNTVTIQAVSSYANAQYAVTTGDLNGDGRIDLISTDYNGDAINVSLRNANGTFAASVSYFIGTGAGSRQVALGDFNGDGVLDVVSANYSAQSVSMLLGRGNGTFGTARSTAMNGTIHDVDIGDFNRDGVQDILATNRSDGRLNIFTGAVKDGAGPLLPFDLGTQVGARQALPAFDEKLRQLSAQRGKIGAFQARVGVGINNLQAAVENYAAAESRIRDADIAQESADLVRLQILQQAATSILGQANQQPQLAFALLKGGN